MFKGSTNDIKIAEKKIRYTYSFIDLCSYPIPMHETGYSWEILHLRDQLREILMWTKKNKRELSIISTASSSDTHLVTIILLLQLVMYLTILLSLLYIY